MSTGIMVRNRKTAPVAGTARKTGTIRDLDLIGGRVCLDFVNTVGWRGTERPRDWLRNYGDLLAWSARARMVSAKEAAALRRRAARRPKQAEQALRRACELRETIYQIVSRLSCGASPGDADIEAINRSFASAPPRHALAWTKEGFAWRAQDAAADLDRPLWAILWSTAEMLTGRELDRIKLCDGRGCGWLFYDTSRSRRRRWCSMADCGNRAKARRHYARSKAGA